MSPDALLWILPAGCAIYVLLAVMLIASRDRASRGGAHWLMLVLAVWLFRGMLEIAGQGEAARVAGRQLSFACAALLPPLGLLTVLHFTGRRMAAGARALLFAVPCMTLVVLLLQRFDAMPADGLALPLATVRAIGLEQAHWFNLVHAPYSFALVALSIGLLLRSAMRRGPGRRRHILLMTLAALAPIVGSVLHVAGVDLYFESPTALLFAAVSPLVAWLVLRHGVLTALPVRHEVLFEQMYDGLIVVNELREIIVVNAAAATLMGLDAGRTLGLKLDEALPDLTEVIEDLATHGDEREIERDRRHVALRLTTVRDAGVDTVVYLLRCRDVTDERTARRQLVRSEELLSGLIQNSSNAILRLRHDGGDDYQVTIANPVAAELFDSALERLVGRGLSATLGAMKSDELRRSLQPILPAIEDAASSGQAAETEFRVRAGDDERWYRMVAYPVGDDIGITCVDITRQREQERELESAAFMDPLTGVLNRRGFERRASACLAGQADDATGALLFVDLNNFKRVNDIHGHETGDLVLQMAAERLCGALRDHDIVARLGGDEFVVLTPDTSPANAETLRERVERVLCEPYRVGNKAMNSSASVGMARFPDEGVTLTSLLRSADAAMYERKSSGRTTASGSFRLVNAPD